MRSPRYKKIKTLIFSGAEREESIIVIGGVLVRKRCERNPEKESIKNKSFLKNIKEKKKGFYVLRKGDV